MKVTNGTSFKVIAYGFDLNGYGRDIIIYPGESLDVYGPYRGTTAEGKSFFLAIPGEIFCHEDPNGNPEFFIAPGKPVRWKTGEVGVVIRHFSEPVDSDVAAWRRDELYVAA